MGEPTDLLFGLVELAYRPEFERIRKCWRIIRQRLPQGRTDFAMEERLAASQAFCEAMRVSWQQGKAADPNAANPWGEADL